MLEDYLKHKLPFGAMKHWGFVHWKIIELNRQRIFQQTMVDDQKGSWKPLQNDVNILEKQSPMNLGFGNYEKYEYPNCRLISAFFKGIMIITLIYFDVNWCHFCNGYNGIDHGRANNMILVRLINQCIQKPIVSYHQLKQTNVFELDLSQCIQTNSNQFKPWLSTQTLSNQQDKAPPWDCYVTLSGANSPIKIAKRLRQS